MDAFDDILVISILAVVPPPAIENEPWAGANINDEFVAAPINPRAFVFIDAPIEFDMVTSIRVITETEPFCVAVLVVAPTATQYCPGESDIPRSASIILFPVRAVKLDV